MSPGSHAGVTRPVTAVLGEWRLSLGTLTGGRIEFHALGTLELRRPDGQRIDTLLRRPKRVALLAYLAAATPRGLHSRDRIVALFWPEQNQPRARQALRQALSVLRGELGAEAIVTVGDEEVGLNFSAVACDVVDFDEAIAAGRHTSAMECYRGGFLEAFYIRGARDFEDWLDAVRDRLKGDFSECARTLIKKHRSSGDLTAATLLARRAHQLARDDEVLLRSLIEMLDQSGDLAGALRLYEEFAERLQREYDSKPAPETQALIEAVRARANTIVQRVDPPVPPVPPDPGPRLPLPPAPPARVLRAALASGVLVLAIVLWVWLGPLWPARPSCVRINPFTVDAGTPRWLGDSLAQRVADQLAGFPDFVARSPGHICPWRSKVVWRVSGEVTGNPRLVVEARLSGGSLVIARGDVAQWPVLADSVSGQLVVQVLRSPLDSSLPAGVLPRTRDGMRAFLKAERLFAKARWGAAAQEYALALAVDPTCYLCSWRLSEVGRWFLANSDPTQTPAYLDHVDAFPVRYRSLIRAAHAPLRAGLDTLTAATHSAPYFFLTWFRLGDELFHRGALVGRARAEAIDAFRKCVEQRPDFAPAWEHLAWALALEGDSAGSYTALATLQHLRKPKDDVLALAIHAMVTIGVEWRFASAAEAMQRTDEFLAHPLLKDFPQRAAGPRYLPTFGALRGAVEFGDRFAHDGAHPDLVTSGLIAQLFGHVALGNPDSARRAASDLEERSRTAEYGLLLRELDAALLLLDADATTSAARWPVVAEGLSEFAAMHTAAEGVRRRAAWAFTLMARRAGKPDDRYTALLDREPPPQPLRRLLIADGLARSGHFQQALTASDSLVELTASSLTAHEPMAPFFRAVLHLLRAGWYVQLGNRGDARAELLWHQNLDDHGWLTREPQMAEGDWALGTLAQWRLARLLDLTGDQRGATCRAYGEVVRLWSGGEPRYAARVDTARARLAALGC
jgi:serine/threonine-protein kinase